MHVEENELELRMLGLQGINFAVGTISAARQQMVGSQIAQIIEMEGVTEKQIMTGIEFELGKTTFAIRAPCDMEVIKTFNLYSRTMGYDAIQLNPLIAVLYRNLNNGHLGILEITEYVSHHQLFGFKYKYTKHFENIKPGAMFDKDTVFADAPSVTDDGMYCYGREIETAYLSMHSTGEDGLIFDEAELDAMSYRTLIKKTVQWGRTHYPVNLYVGANGEFKGMPDIGEYVHPSGILMALREHSPELDIVGLNKHDLCNVDYFYDDLIYAAGPNGRIVDIRVWYDDRSPHNATPRGMEKQPMKYLVAKRAFSTELLAKVREIGAKNHSTQTLEPRLHEMLIDALREVEPGTNAIENMDGTERVDIWRVEFTIEYVHVPDIRSKFSNTAGGKGVVVKVMKTEDMPIDDFGNRAGMIVSPDSPLNRNNTQQWYEQAINAYNRDLLHHMRKLIGHPPREVVSGAKIVLGRQTKETIDELIRLLTNHYQVISGLMYNQFCSMSHDEKLARLASILSDKLYILKPPNDPEELLDIAIKLREMYRGTIEQLSPVTYRSYTGELERTVKNVLIGSTYMIQLEKTGDSWAAVASADFQHHGVPATISKLNRHSHPHRNQPTRAIGEAEAQLISAHGSPEAIAEWMDRNNSPVTHRAMVRSIYSSPTPSNIPVAVNRNKIPLGNAKPMRLVKHLMQCAGMRFKFEVSSRVQKYWEYLKSTTNKG